MRQHRRMCIISAAWLTLAMSVCTVAQALKITILDPPKDSVFHVGDSQTFSAKLEDFGDTEWEWAWFFSDTGQQEGGVGHNEPNSPPIVVTVNHSLDQAGGPFFAVIAAEDAEGGGHAEQFVYFQTVSLDGIAVAGATQVPQTTNYTVAQQEGNVTGTAVLTPALGAGELPANFVTWQGGNQGADQLQRLVPRANPTDTTVTATSGTVSKSARIVVRRACPVNNPVTPQPNPTVNNNSTTGSWVQPDYPQMSWHACSGPGETWQVHIESVTCPGSVNIEPWPSHPNQMVVPNTPNPVDGGNINNVAGSPNRWAYANQDLADYDTIGGGSGPHWHDTASDIAHEWHHWDTDWMTDSLGPAGGDWAQTEVDLETITVSALTALTEQDAQTALQPQVTQTYNAFLTACAARWNAIGATDHPGFGGAAYAAGAVALDAHIQAITAYKNAKGW